MERFKKYKGQLLFTLILVFAVLAMPFQNYTERTFSSSDITYGEEYAATVREENDTLIISEGPNPYLLNTENLYFKKGTYEVTFNILAYGEGSRVEICDPLVLNADNTSGEILAAAEIPLTGENIHLTFTVEEYVQTIQFRIFCDSPLVFGSIYLLSEQGLYNDPYIYAGLILLGSAILLWYRTQRKLRMDILILLGFAAVWASVPLSYTWLYDGHDLYFHYGRLFTLSESLVHGQFPVRMHSSMYLGMGYLCPIFYPEFFLYPFALLGILGMSPIGCYKALLLAVNFATAGVAYYSFSRLCGSRKIGSIAAFLYTLSMYRLINLYTRAAVGEVLAAIFLPLLLLGMYQLFMGNSRKWVTAALAFTALFQSHIISTMLAVGFGVLFAFCFLKHLREHKRLLHLGLAAVTTLLLNVWFLIPLLDHLRYSVYTLNDTRKLAGYSLFVSQLFDVGVNNPAALAEGSNTVTPEMPYSIGVVLLMGILLFIFTALRKKSKHIRLGYYCLGMGILALYASSSLFPWDFIQRFALLDKLAGSIQFASRFLPFATVFLCLTAAVGIYHFFNDSQQRQLLFILCAMVTIYSSGTYFSNYIEQSRAFVTRENQMDRSHDTDFLYLFDNQGDYFSVRRMYLQSASLEPSLGVTLSNCYRKGNNAGFTYTKAAALSNAYVDVSFNNYPYFHAYDSSGNPLETSLNELLRLRVLLPKAESDSITIRFELPFYYRLGDCISLGTAILLLGYFLIFKGLHRWIQSK